MRGCKASVGIMCFVMTSLVAFEPLPTSTGAGLLADAAVEGGPGYGSAGCEDHVSQAVIYLLRPSGDRPGSAPLVDVRSTADPVIASRLNQDLPDLTVADTWTVPAVFCRNQAVEMCVLVENIGMADVVDSFFFDMWFDGANVGYARIPGLAAGADVELCLSSFIWPDDTTSHAVSAMADTDHEIEEEIEINNIHLEFFAADLCTTCAEVVIPFVEGWNWFSLNTSEGDMSLDHILAPIEGSGTYIKNQTSYAEYIPEWGGWFGPLESLTCTEAYLIRMADPDTLEFCAFPYAVCTPMPVDSGWNWISYLPRQGLEPDEALGSLDSSGAYIKNQTSYAEYIVAWGGWFGTLSAMEPFGGYKIKMAAGDTLVYPDSVELATYVTSPSRHTLSSGSDKARWHVKPRRYEFNGSITARVVGQHGQRVSAGDMLGAFVGTECRGLAEARRTPSGDWMFCLMIHGNDAGSEILEFRLYDADQDGIIEIPEVFEFTADMTLGSALSPCVVHCWGDMASDCDSFRPATGLLESRPNPLRLRSSIAYMVSEASEVVIAVYDTQGRMVRQLVDGYVEAGDHSVSWDGSGLDGKRVACGVYFCRMVVADRSSIAKIMVLR
jgi:hypothetical protein